MAWRKASGTSFVTTLPSSPVDGQEIYYQSTTAGTGGGSTNSMADVGAVWHLRYRAASSSSYKWEAVGVSPIYHNVETEESTTSGPYAALTTVGPLMTAPLAGDYLIQFGAAAINLTSNYTSYMSIELGTTAIEANGIRPVGVNLQHNSREIRPTLTSATTSLVAKYKSEAATTAYFSKRWLRITPIRVG